MNPLPFPVAEFPSSFLIFFEEGTQEERRRSGVALRIPHPSSGFGTQPPAIAPTIRKGSAPVTTASGNLVSGGSRDRSSLQAKNLTNGLRRSVTWSRIVPRSTG